LFTRFIKSTPQKLRKQNVKCGFSAPTLEIPHCSTLLHGSLRPPPVVGQRPRVRKVITPAKVESGQGLPKSQILERILKYPLPSACQAKFSSFLIFFQKNFLQGKRGTSAWGDRKGRAQQNTLPKLRSVASQSRKGANIQEDFFMIFHF
jgi:hypothetical protein